jgi:hypothetical protein
MLSRPIPGGASSTSTLLVATCPCEAERVIHRRIMRSRAKRACRRRSTSCSSSRPARRQHGAEAPSEDPVAGADRRVVRQARAELTRLSPAIQAHIFTSESDLAEQMLAYVETYNQTARPFRWTYAGKVREA